MPYPVIPNIHSTLQTAPPKSAAATVARELLLASDAGKIAVRLLGVTVSNFPELEKIESPTGVWLQPEFDFGEEL